MAQGQGRGPWRAESRKVQPHPAPASWKSQQLGPCPPSSWTTVFPFFPVEQVTVSTLLHQALTQEFSLLFVPFGRRFGFLPPTSSGRRSTPGMNGQRAGHTIPAFSKGRGVDHRGAHRGLLDLDSHSEKLTVSQVFTVLQMTSWGTSQWVLIGLSVPRSWQSPSNIKLRSQTQRPQQTRLSHRN